MKTLLGVSVILGLAAGIYSQRIWSGACPNPAVKSNFDINRYMGDWYEFERDFTFFQLFLDCGRARYTLNPNGTVTVQNTGRNLLSNRVSEVFGIAKVKDNAKFNVKFPTGPQDDDANYWVINTDYDRFAIVYSCTELKFWKWTFKTEIVWILSRQRNGLSTGEVDAIYQELQDKGIDPRGKFLSFFGRINQNNCPF